MFQTTKNKLSVQGKQEIKSNTNIPISNFLFALKSPESRRQYPRRLKMFFDFDLDKSLPLEEQANLFLTKASTKKTPIGGHSGQLNTLFNSYNFRRKGLKKKVISESTIPNYYKAAKLFCVMNDVLLNWDKIGKGVPYEKKAADDRPPTLEEITKLLEYPDKRIRPIILTMISSGIRLGAFDYLRWKHIQPIRENNGTVIAASLLVYATDQEQYSTFITPRHMKH